MYSHRERGSQTTSNAATIALLTFLGTLGGYGLALSVISVRNSASNYAQSNTLSRPVAYTSTSTFVRSLQASRAELGSDMVYEVDSVKPTGSLHSVPSHQSWWSSLNLSFTEATWLTSAALAVVAAVLTWARRSQNSELSLASTSAWKPPSMELKSGPLESFFDKRKTVIITGASSGLGRETARALAQSGKWYVIMACRDVSKGNAAAKELGLKEGSYEVMNLELESFRSVRNFCKEVRSKGRQLDALVCNAALYLPNQRSPDFTEDGFERCFQVNHLSHYLMIRLLLDDIAKSKHKRIIVVGSITGNNNTVGGGAVYPLADLGQLQGMKAGMQEPICMIDGKAWNGAKAYKDSKVCNMMTVRELHRRYHKKLGITFSTMYPGCIAESNLFRQKRGWFRFIFPLFMKYVTGGYVSQEEAGDRLAECVDSPATEKSGVYWSWNGGARTVAYFAKEGNKVVLTGAGGAGGALFENEPSELVRDPYTANEMYTLSEGLCGLKPDPRAKNAEAALP